MRHLTLGLLLGIGGLVAYWFLGWIGWGAYWATILWIQTEDTCQKH